MAECVPHAIRVTALQALAGQQTPLLVPSGMTGTLGLYDALGTFRHQMRSFNVPDPSANNVWWGDADGVDEFDRRIRGLNMLAGASRTFAWHGGSQSSYATAPDTSGDYLSFRCNVTGLVRVEMLDELGGVIGAITIGSADTGITKTLYIDGRPNGAIARTPTELEDADPDPGVFDTDTTMAPTSKSGRRVVWNALAPPADGMAGHVGVYILPGDGGAGEFDMLYFFDSEGDRIEPTYHEESANGRYRYEVTQPAEQILYIGCAHDPITLDDDKPWGVDASIYLDLAAMPGTPRGNPPVFVIWRRLFDQPAEPEDFWTARIGTTEAP